MATAGRLDTSDAERIRGWEARLHHELGIRPKSPQWRLRACVGDRVRWYDVPEDDY